MDFTIEQTVDQLLREANAIQNPPLKLRLFLQLDYYFMKNPEMETKKFPLYEKVQNELKDHYLQE